MDYQGREVMFVLRTTVKKELLESVGKATTLQEVSDLFGRGEKGRGESLSTSMELS